MSKIRNPRLLFPFFMALIMAFVMSGFMTLINRGLIENFFFVWMHLFIYAFFVAFPTAYFVAPQVQKLVKKICQD
ncbi:MAG: DUF2798 domain-containing protein [Rickettsiales bacterium]|nr:DUF2798 domain-containing protein [Rickettsiales bacterium]